MEADKVKAYGGWVLLKPEGPIKITPGGLHVPDDNIAAKVGYGIGRVISAGPGYWKKEKDPPRDKFRKMEVKAGQRVAYRIHLNNAIKFGDHSFIHMHDLELIVDDDTQLNLGHPYDN